MTNAILLNGGNLFNLTNNIFGNSASYAIASSGAYNISVSNNVLATYSQISTISAIFTNAAAAWYPTGLTFTDASTGYPSPSAWNWSFGDGSYSTTQSPSHTWAAPGTYTVTENASSSLAYSINTTSVSISQQDFSASVLTATAPVTITFTDLTTPSIGSQWNWSFGDGTYGTTQNAAHTYTNTGATNLTYTISEIVYNQAAGSQTVTKTNYITIMPGAPVSGFTASPVIGLFPLTVQFNLTSPSTNAAYVNWSFGDGNVVNLTSPSAWNVSHLYSTGGTYTVIETAANAGGSNTTTMTGLITVENTTVSGFTCVPTTGALNVNTVCNVTIPKDNATTWLWNLGDGTFATTQNVTHTYTKVGTYTISEEAMNTPWSANTTTLTNYITVTWAPVVGSPSWAPSSVMKLGNTYLLTETFNGSISGVGVDCDATPNFTIVDLGTYAPVTRTGVGTYQIPYTPTDPGIYTWQITGLIGGNPVADSGKISVLY
jgi:PKD repeat protein